MSELVDYSPGTEVYFTGDAEGAAGFGRITEFHPPDGTFLPAMYDVTMSDGRNMAVKATAFGAKPYRKWWLKSETQHRLATWSDLLAACEKASNTLEFLATDAEAQLNGTMADRRPEDAMRKWMQDASDTLRLLNKAIAEARKVEP